MDLLTPQDVQASRAAWEDLLDTYCTLPIRYFRAGSLPDAWGEKSPETTAHEWLAYYQQSKNQTDVIFTAPTGSYDDSDGFFLLSFLRLQEQGFVDGNGSLVLNPNTDRIEAFGRQYKILGIHPDGYLKDRFTAVYIIVKLQPNTA